MGCHLVSFDHLNVVIPQEIHYSVSNVVTYYFSESSNAAVFALLRSNVLLLRNRAHQRIYTRTTLQPFPTDITLSDGHYSSDKFSVSEYI